MKRRFTKKLICTSVILTILQGCSYVKLVDAQINEAPVSGKVYNDHLYYDNEGSKVISIQQSKLGQTNDYYFNKGATIDASNGGVHSTILVDSYPVADSKTKSVFHIGDGQVFNVKSYTGNGNVNIQEKATLHIIGGDVVLENGIKDSYMDNTNAAIHIESYGNARIDSNSLYMGNKRLQDGKCNVGGISLVEPDYGTGNGSVVDIKLKDSFAADNVDFGLALESFQATKNSVNINAGNNININAFNNTSYEQLYGYRGAGIYSLAFRNENGSTDVNLNSANGNVTVKAQSYGYYGYGNASANFIAKNGNISITSAKNHGICAMNELANQNNRVVIEGKNVNVGGGKNGVKLSNAILTSKADNFTVSGKSYALYMDSKAQMSLNTAQSVRINSTSGGCYIMDSSFNSVSDSFSVNANNYSIYTDNNAKADVTAKNIGIKGNTYAMLMYNSSQVNLNGDKVFVNGDNYNVFMDSKAELNIAAKKAGVMSKGTALYMKNEAKANIQASDIYIKGNSNTLQTGAQLNLTGSNVHIDAKNNWAVNLFSGAKSNIIADNAIVDGWYYVNTAGASFKADNTIVNGFVKAVDGGVVDFASKANDSNGLTFIHSNGYTAVNATSATADQSVINFKQGAVINAYEKQNNAFVTDYVNKPFAGVANAISVTGNSVVNMNNADNSYQVYGDIVAGCDGNGGKVDIKGTKSVIKGDVLAGNKGVVELQLSNSMLEGRLDSFSDAGKGNLLMDPQYQVTESGTINASLKNSIWNARHQSWVSSLSLNNSVVDLTKDGASSVVMDKLSGSGVFNMELNSADHSKSDMLYIGDGNGDHIVNIVGGIKGGLENISEENPLRFATVQNSHGSFSVPYAVTEGAGIYDLEYIVKKEDFNKADPENEKYNGAGDGSVNGDKGFKPGNNYVENVLDANDTAENWIITGVSKKLNATISDSIENVSRSGYKNSIYIDRLNKRLGEARYIDGDEGMWVRIRHDRLGLKDAYRSHNTMYQLGYDKLHKKYPNGDRHVGAAIDYMESSTSFSNAAGSAESKRWAGTLYDTWLGNKGHYADYVAKIGYMHNEFDVELAGNDKTVSGKYKHAVFAVGAEYGRKKMLEDGWYIEPQVQLQLARLTDASYTTSQGSEVYADAVNSLIGRVGFRLGRDVDENTTMYIKADVLHEFLGEQSVSTYDATGSWNTTMENNGTWYDLGFGLSTALGHSTYAYVDFEQSFGNDNDDTYEINVGLQWDFK